MHKREIREKIYTYRQEGFSYSEIASLTGIPKSTIACWLRPQQFSNAITQRNTQLARRENRKKMRLINSYRRRAHEQMYANEAATAQTLFTHFCTHANFIAGITVYLACGDSTKTAPITLSSAKPELHALFLPFLQQYLGVDLSSVKYVLTIPEDATESEVKKRWRPYLFRPAKAAFYPTQRVSTKAQHTSPMGSVRIIVSDRARKARLLTWCDLLTHKRSDSELTSRQK